MSNKIYPIGIQNFEKIRNRSDKRKIFKISAGFNSKTRNKMDHGIITLGFIPTRDNPKIDSIPQIVSW